MTIAEEHGKTIGLDTIFIDTDQYGGRKDINKYN